MFKKKPKKPEAEQAVFLEHKQKKAWTEREGKCFMLYARTLYITWGTREYWIWDCFKETIEGRENIEVAKLSHVCWLDVRGKFKISELTDGKEYEVVYLVKLTKSASGWELPIFLRLSLPDGTVRQRQVSLFEKPKASSFELSVGRFNAQSGEAGEVCFDLYEHGGHWKSGLIIQGAIIRPFN